MNLQGGFYWSMSFCLKILDLEKKGREKSTDLEWALDVNEHESYKKDILQQKPFFQGF